MAPSTEFLVAVAKQKLLKTNEKGTFANDSFLTRLPHLVLDVATNNRPRLTEKQYLDLLNLAEDLKNDAQIPPLITPENKSTKDREDTKKWMHLLTIFEFSWQNAPWFYAEAYMFRLVLQLSGFYETGVDPFHYSKLAELNEKTPWKLLEEALVTAESSSDGVGAESSLTREEKLKILIKFSLWGNKADGCYKVVKDTVSGNGASLAVEDKYLLVDDTDKVLCYLKERGNDDITIQFINDNCGTELLLDLALADHLITHVSVTLRFTLHFWI
jgi:hypothetical protein